MDIDFNATGSLLNQSNKTFLKRHSQFRFRWSQSQAENIGIIKRGAIFTDSKLNDENFVITDEVRELATWMSDTQNKGLALIGSSGRGKTLFLHGILPHLLISKGKVPNMAKAAEMTTQNRQKILLIDEVGREDLVFDKSMGKIDRFPMYVDFCADYSWPLFFTSNLTKQEFIDRYGQHIFNRVISQSKVIVHNGSSMW